MPSLQHPPPYTLLTKWMDGVSGSASARLSPKYDDILEVLRALLRAVPVDEPWYMSQYPGIADFVARTPTETPASHYQKHGYFEGRRPFAPGWSNLTEPAAFAAIRTRLRIVPARGKLLVDITRDEVADVIKAILRSVPVDEPWYRETYPVAAKDVDAGRFSSVTEHYVALGYSQGCLPHEPDVNEAWYVTRYEHIRNGIDSGVARTPKEHFIRIGYQEGCRPTPP
jgi:hypothetical protein